jgi:hypothetical protein
MWVCLSDAFLSIVAHRDRPEDLLVRARVAGDIERVFPGFPVSQTTQADYLFRAIVPRAVVGQALTDVAAGIGYDNFKQSVPDDARHAAYFDVWLALRKMQDGTSLRRAGFSDP